MLKNMPLCQNNSSSPSSSRDRGPNTPTDARTILKLLQVTPMLLQSEDLTTWTMEHTPVDTELSDGTPTTPCILGDRCKYHQTIRFQNHLPSKSQTLIHSD